jgi:hypothetical protein
MGLEAFCAFTFVAISSANHKPRIPNFLGWGLGLYYCPIGPRDGCVAICS